MPLPLSFTLKRVKTRQSSRVLIAGAPSQQSLGSTRAHWIVMMMFTDDFSSFCRTPSTLRLADPPSGGLRCHSSMLVVQPISKRGSTVDHPLLLAEPLDCHSIAVQGISKALCSCPCSRLLIMPLLQGKLDLKKSLPWALRFFFVLEEKGFTRRRPYGEKPCNLCRVLLCPLKLTHVKWNGGHQKDPAKKLLGKDSFSSSNTGCRESECCLLTDGKYTNCQTLEEKIGTSIAWTLQVWQGPGRLFMSGLTATETIGGTSQFLVVHSLECVLV
jgi:hypothetical protein